MNIAIERGSITLEGNQKEKKKMEGTMQRYAVENIISTLNRRRLSKEIQVS